MKVSNSIYYNKPLVTSFRSNSASFSNPNYVHTNTNNYNKTTLTLGMLALGALLSIPAYRYCKSKYIEKAQKVFSEVYMRDDISKEKTIEILKKYKELNKIKDDKEYIKAVFEETKKNYGFEKSNIKISIEAIEGPSGAWSFPQGKILIDPKCSRNRIVGLMHHEMRHAKQSFYAANYSPEEYTKAIIQRADLKDSLSKLTASKSEVQEVIESIVPDNMSLFFNTQPNKKLVPEKYHDFAKKCIEGNKSYVNSKVDRKKYRENFLEKDAYEQQAKVNKVFRFLNFFMH